MRKQVAANVLLIRKKNGSIRMEVNSRAVSRVTIKYRYPMEDVWILFLQSNVLQFRSFFWLHNV